MPPPSSSSASAADPRIASALAELDALETHVRSWHRTSKQSLTDQYLQFAAVIAAMRSAKDNGNTNGDDAFGVSGAAAVPNAISGTPTAESLTPAGSDCGAGDASSTAPLVGGLPQPTAASIAAKSLNKDAPVFRPFVSGASAAAAGGVGTPSSGGAAAAAGVPTPVTASLGGRQTSAFGASINSTAANATTASSNGAGAGGFDWESLMGGAPASVGGANRTSAAAIHSDPLSLNTTAPTSPSAHQAGASAAAVAAAAVAVSHGAVVTSSVSTPGSFIVVAPNGCNTAQLSRQPSNLIMRSASTVVSNNNNGSSNNGAANSSNTNGAGAPLPAPIVPPNGGVAVVGGASRGPPVTVQQVHSATMNASGAISHSNTNNVVATTTAVSTASAAAGTPSPATPTPAPSTTTSAPVVTVGNNGSLIPQNQQQLLAAQQQQGHAHTREASGADYDSFLDEYMNTTNSNKASAPAPLSASLRSGNAAPSALHHGFGSSSALLGGNNNRNANSNKAAANAATAPLSPSALETSLLNMSGASSVSQHQGFASPPVAHIGSLDHHHQHHSSSSAIVGHHHAGASSSITVGGTRSTVMAPSHNNTNSHHQHQMTSSVSSVNSSSGVQHHHHGGGNNGGGGYGSNTNAHHHHGNNNGGNGNNNNSAFSNVTSASQLYASGAPSCQVLVEFKRKRVLQFESKEFVTAGEFVVVGGDRGEDIGVVTHVWPTGSAEPTGAWNGSIGIGKVLRPATLLEISQLQGVQFELETRAVEVAQEKVVEHQLPMRIVDAEYQFDRKKLTFYYQSNHRLDFRNLVRDLYKTFRARIWMEQD